MQRLEMRTITYKNSQLFLKKTWWVWEDLNLRPHPYQRYSQTSTTSSGGGCFVSLVSVKRQLEIIEECLIR